MSHWLVTLEPGREEREHIHPADSSILRDKAGSVEADQGPGPPSRQRRRLPAAPVLRLELAGTGIASRSRSRLKPGEGLAKDLRPSWSPHHLKHPRGPLKARWHPAVVGASQIQLAQLGGGQRLLDEPSVLKKQHPLIVRSVQLSLTHGTSSDLIPALALRGGLFLSPFTEEAVRPGAAKAVAQGS